MLTGAIVDIGEQARERRAAVPKRQYSLEYKLQVVKETREPGASVSIVARRHDINTNIVFRWRKLFREGRLGGGTPAGRQLPAPEFVPIRVAPDAPAMPALPAPEKPGDESVKAARAAGAGRTPGLIEVVLRNGVRVRVDAHVDDKALRRVVAAVRDLP